MPDNENKFVPEQVSEAVDKSPEKKETGDCEDNAKEKILDFNEESLFTHGTYIRELESFVKFGIDPKFSQDGHIGIHYSGEILTKNNPNVLSQNGDRGIFWMGIFDKIMMSDDVNRGSGKYNFWEVGTYPFFLLIDPYMLFKDNKKTGIKMDYEKWCPKMEGTLSKEDFIKSCVGIVISDDEILVSAFNKPKISDEFIQKAEEYKLDIDKLRKRNKIISSEVAGRWLRVKMKEWFKNYGFSAPIYDKDHNLLWTEITKEQREKLSEENSEKHRVQILKLESVLKKLEKEKKSLEDSQNAEIKAKEQDCIERSHELTAEKIKVYKEIYEKTKQHLSNWGWALKKGKEVEVWPIEDLILLIDPDLKKYIQQNFGIPKDPRSLRKEEINWHEIYHYDMTNRKEYQLKRSNYSESLIDKKEKVKSTNFFLFRDIVSWMNKHDSENFEDLDKDSLREFENWVFERILSDDKRLIERDIKNKNQKNFEDIEDRIGLLKRTIKFYLENE